MNTPPVIVTILFDGHEEIVWRLKMRKDKNIGCVLIKKNKNSEIYYYEELERNTDWELLPPDYQEKLLGLL
jgi:hypothetical protein